ncbi:glycosyltransferase [Thermithiobacillus plumbiphilus]|uniref:Glycosyltransferase n=1 Tax=Thermithiobacillus plumbiphilus TaxID=1729899 RepID=A0ABU9D5Z6_9PROT
MRYVVLSPVNILRRDVTGGTEDIKRRAEAMVDAGLNIKKIFCVDRDAEIARDSVLKDSIGIYKRGFFPSPKALILPYPIVSRYNKELLSEVVKWDQPGVTMIFEGLHMSLYRFLIPIQKAKTFLRVHNIESDYHLALANMSQTVRHKIAHNVVAHQYRQYEKEVYTKFDGYIFISSSEMEKAKGKCPDLNSKAIWAPPLVDVDAISKRSEYVVSKNKLVYFGDLRVSANLASVNWFIREVFSKIKQSVPDVEFHVAGQGAFDIVRLPHVYVHGFVPSIEEFVADSAAIVIPSLACAGVQIKLIDAVSFGKPVLTTSQVIEGTEFGKACPFPTADTAEDMIGLAIDLLNNRKKYMAQAERAFQTLLKSHTAETYISILNRLST